MESSKDDIRTASVNCQSKLNLNFTLVQNCMNSRLGNLLQHDNAALTEQLTPAHEYVPWVTLNGVHTEDIQNQAQDNLVELICKTYKVN